MLRATGTCPGGPFRPRDFAPFVLYTPKGLIIQVERAFIGTHRAAIVPESTKREETNGLNK